ncbi:hypothetical protein GUJ93_ZPchr0001g30924 [Zizania palustris]|uniref:Uncharacterized protein n=1 Tax=Zizania palustris TaxID=103762 RepID=A0A8J5RIF2_ZIZPA|nr:hypothetical protein GUJ93_ZPchr0001g30924 [Zizania palustris]
MEVVLSVTASGNDILQYKIFGGEGAELMCLDRGAQPNMVEAPSRCAITRGKLDAARVPIPSSPQAILTPSVLQPDLLSAAVAGSLPWLKPPYRWSRPPRPHHGLVVEH